jgi:hypothetical protein
MRHYVWLDYTFKRLIFREDESRQEFVFMLCSLFWARGLAEFLPLPMGVFVYSSIFFNCLPFPLNGTVLSGSLGPL